MEVEEESGSVDAVLVVEQGGVCGNQSHPESPSSAPSSNVENQTQGNYVMNGGGLWC